MTKNSSGMLLRQTIALYSPSTSTLGKVKKSLETIKSTEGFQNVGFVIFHGSAAEGRALPDSDIDICVYYEGTPKEQWDYRMSLLKALPDVFDVQIFQPLPLHVRREVLKGKTVYVKDKKSFQKIAEETRKEYEAVRPRFARELKEETEKIRAELIHSKLEEAEDAINYIEENLPQNLSAFINNRMLKGSIYKEIENAIECLVDACAVLNADLSLGKPSDVDDILANLANAGILRKETGEKIKEMKRFRNVLVHKYGKINDEMAYADVKEGLQDIRSAIKEMRDKFGIGNALIKK